jgi:hypothetical protein
MMWSRRRYLTLGVSGILSSALVISILAYAFFGNNRSDPQRGFAAYRAEQPIPSPK